MYWYTLDWKKKSDMRVINNNVNFWVKKQKNDNEREDDNDKEEKKRKQSA